MERKHERLKRAIINVPRFEAGMRCSMDMVKAYFKNRILEKMDIPQEGKQCAEVIFNFLAVYVPSIENGLCKYFDENPPFQLEEAILSGSWSEGLVLYEPAKFDPPDVDFMCVLKNISFSVADQMCGDLSINEDTPFVNVYLSDINLLKTWQSFLVEPASEALEGKICQLSSTKLKERLHENYSRGDLFRAWAMQCNPVTDSPAIQISNVSRGLSRHGPFWQRLFETVACYVWRCSDLVLAIPCDGWPQNALEWIHRERQWPSEEIIEKISQQGFHIVAKTSHEGNFRLSFSVAEGILVKNMNKIQVKMVRAFKAVIKFLVLCDGEDKKFLCSYHLKTVAFWYFERSAPESWTEENITSHFFQMLAELVQALRKRNLPMYFLRGYNLFGSVENSTDLEILADKVEGISRDIHGLTKAIRMGANFRFYKNYIQFLKELNISPPQY